MIFKPLFYFITLNKSTNRSYDIKEKNSEEKQTFTSFL